MGGVRRRPLHAGRDVYMSATISLYERVLRRQALRFRRWAQARNQGGIEAVLGAARATMARKKYCLLATAGDDGIDARVLQPFPPGPDLDVWLGTSPRSRKAAQLRADPRATLAYQDDGRAACVVLVGTIDLVETLEERRRHFKQSWWAFYPDGPGGDDFTLLHFVPQRIEVWDAHRGITPEPFGMRAAKLVRCDGKWSEP